MAIDPQELLNDQRIKDYLEQEAEFADAFAARIAQAHPDWDTRLINYSYETYFFGPFFSTIKDWRKTISPKMEDNQLLEDLEEASDDPTDPTYQEIRMPTLLYQWAYLYLKFVPAKYNMANDEQLHELVVRMFRTQHYDAELLGLGSQNAYPLAEDLVSPSSSPNPENVTMAGPALIHRLPPEILSDIFLRARDGWLYLPLVVSHVDSRFRAVAESTAVLWTIIDVYLPSPLVSLYLQRSGTALLDVRIDLRGMRIWKDVESLFPPFFALVADHRERIASLRMSAFIREFLDEMVNAMMVESGSTYPQLRRLDTGYLMWVGRRGMDEPLNCPVVVPPQLQELSLRGCRSRNWVRAFPEPLVRLKSLCLVNNRDLFLSDVLIVLANLPNLEILVLQDCTIKQGAFTAPSAVTLSTLKTLQYVTLDHNSIASMNQALLSPKLTSLKLWWDDCSDREDRASLLHQAQSLLAMLAANPQLESLDLCNCPMEQQGWRKAFSKAGCLKSLRLRWCESESNNLVGCLEHDQGEDVEQDLLPYLELLVLENVFHLTTKDIRRIIMRRPALRSIELRGWDGSNVAEEDVQFIRESAECFIVETFCNGSGLLEEENEGSEKGSSSGTPSEGSWLSGDEEVHA